MTKERSVVGDLINFRGMIYSPVNEQGVVYLFSKVAEDLNMYVEEVRTAYPDCIVRRFNGKGWEKLYIEFEFTSSNFKQHGHDPDECDIVVCWDHDWDDCPLEVLELSEIIKDLPNREIERPRAATRGTAANPEERRDPAQVFEDNGIPTPIADLYYAFEERALGIDEGIWRKVLTNQFSYYSPKRSFMTVTPAKGHLLVWLYTGGQPIDGVAPMRSETAGKRQGRLWIRTPEDIGPAVVAATESWKRLVDAVDRNEPTGWYAPLADEEDAGEDGTKGPVVEEEDAE